MSSEFCPDIKGRSKNLRVSVVDTLFVYCTLYVNPAIARCWHSFPTKKNNKIEIEDTVY